MFLDPDMFWIAPIPWPHLLPPNTDIATVMQLRGESVPPCPTQPATVSTVDLDASRLVSADSDLESWCADLAPYNLGRARVNATADSLRVWYLYPNFVMFAGPVTSLPNATALGDWSPVGLFRNLPLDTGGATVHYLVAPAAATARHHHGGHDG